MEKVIRDGKVAVIISPDYGSGWYTWASGEGNKALLFDPQLVAAVEAGDLDAIAARAKSLCPKAFLGSNVEDLEIEWVPEGATFRINEYDGSESLVLQSEDDWIVA